MADTHNHLKLEGVPVVTLYVGPDKVVFHIHQNLLFDASPVFKAAFSGNFKEGSERSMSLPDDDKDSVGHMVHWLYSSKLDLTLPVSTEASYEWYMQLAKLNTLAEKFDIRLLRNRIIDELFRLAESPRNLYVPHLDVVTHVYNNTTGRSNFRKLLVSWYVYLIKYNWYNMDSTRDGLALSSQDFAIDLVIEMAATQLDPNRKSAFKQSSSVFHEMAPEEVDLDHISQEAK